MAYCARTRRQKSLAMFRNAYNIPLIHADESTLFLGRAGGRERPEVKRKTIGRLFIDVFQKHASAIVGAAFLAQGTLYPRCDRIGLVQWRAFCDDQKPSQCGRPARKDGA